MNNLSELYYIEFHRSLCLLTIGSAAQYGSGKQVGFIGLGNMGGPMALNLLKRVINALKLHKTFLSHSPVR